MADAGPARREVRVSHVFDVPRQAVWAAWTDPEQLARWWAPDRLEIPPESVTVEPRPGGRFELTMVAVDGGARFPYRAEIVEISEPELIVLRAEAIADAGIEETETRITFEEEGEGTRMTVTSGPYTEERREDAEAGWHDLVANLDRLLGRG